MTAQTEPIDERVAGERVLSAPPSSGWMVVAAKEFADQLLSVRFVVLFAISVLFNRRRNY